MKAKVYNEIRLNLLQIERTLRLYPDYQHVSRQIGAALTALAVSRLAEDEPAPQMFDAYR